MTLAQLAEAIMQSAGNIPWGKNHEEKSRLAVKLIDDMTNDSSWYDCNLVTMHDGSQWQGWTW